MATKKEIDVAFEQGIRDRLDLKCENPYGEVSDKNTKDKKISLAWAEGWEYCNFGVCMFQLGVVI